MNESIKKVKARLAKAQVLATLALAKAIIASAKIREVAGCSSAEKQSCDLADEATRMIADIDYPEGTED